MDKREEDILDDILDGEESENYEDIKIPETLIGDPKDENEDKAEDEIKAEDENENEPDLSGFLDEKTEVDGNDPIEPELDKALSEFTDNGDDDSEKSNKKSKKEAERGILEKEIRDKIEQEKKAKNNKFIKNASIIFIAAAVVIAAGLFMFLRLNGSYNPTIMTADNKKVNFEEYKLFILLYQDKDYAVQEIERFLIFEKAMNNRKIELQQDEIDYLKENIEYVKTTYGIPIEKLNISEERLIKIFSSVFGFTESKLTDAVADEKKYLEIVDDSLSAELENYRNTEKLLKYIITETREKCEEARNAIVSGSVSFDDAIKQYYAGYDESQGMPIIELSQTGFSENESSKLTALTGSQISEVINLGGYAVFIAVNDDDTSEKLLKYIVTETPESTEEARNAILSGSLSVDDAIIQYSSYYDESYGIEEIELSQFGLSDENNAKIMNLKESECSDIIELGSFVIFTAATDKEIENRVREYLEENIVIQLFEEEYTLWQSETKIKTNDAVLEKFDMEEFSKKMYEE